MRTWGILTWLVGTISVYRHLLRQSDATDSGSGTRQKRMSILCIIISSLFTNHRHGWLPSDLRKDISRMYIESGDLGINGHETRGVKRCKTRN